jgi:hypothetical protein
MVSVSWASSTTWGSSRKPAVPLMVWKTRKRPLTLSAEAPSLSTVIRISSTRVRPSPLSPRNSPKRPTVSASRSTRTPFPRPGSGGEEAAGGAGADALDGEAIQPAMTASAPVPGSRSSS